MIVDSKIFLGLGNCIDYEILWDKYIFNNLLRNYNINSDDICLKKRIRSIRDILIVILYFIKNNTGGECYISNIKIIENFSKLFEKKITAGGTAFRAAIAMDIQGFNSRVHFVSMNAKIKELLPKKCEYICSSNKFNYNPHLIIQYPKNLKIDVNDINIFSKKEDRIIFVNDPENEQLEINPLLEQHIKDTNVLLISGFNAIKKNELLIKRIDILKKYLKNFPKQSYVFYEDGCFHNEKYSSLVKDYLFDTVDICSMNQNEFKTVVGNYEFLSNPTKLFNCLELFYRKYSLKLIILHTSFWSLSYGYRAKLFSKCLTNGILMSSCRMLFGDSITKMEIAKVKKMNPSKCGTKFSNDVNKIGGNMICCIPSFDLSHDNATTIGLGDFFVGGFLPYLNKLIKS